MRTKKIIRITNGFRETIHLLTLENEIDRAAKHHIPADWPVPQDQHGPWCGLVALNVALAYAKIKILPVRVSEKGGAQQLPLLVRLAIKMGLSSIGDIFCVQYFRLILQAHKIDSGTPIQTSRETFIGSICAQLDQSNTLIVSCDIGEDSFPGTYESRHPHWALIFGYLYLRSGSQPHFLVAHYNRYFLWSAADLLRSNSQDLNTHFPVFNNSEINGANLLMVKTPDEMAKGFYCSFFSIPVEIMSDTPRDPKRRERKECDKQEKETAVKLTGCKVQE